MLCSMAYFLASCKAMLCSSDSLGRGPVSPAVESPLRAPVPMTSGPVWSKLRIGSGIPQSWYVGGELEDIFGEDKKEVTLQSDFL